MLYLYTPPPGSRTIAEGEAGKFVGDKNWGIWRKKKCLLEIKDNLTHELKKKKKLRSPA